MTDAIHADAGEGQSQLLAVSNAMVKIYKSQFGRGPTKARTNWAGPDILISTLQQSLTPAERNLAAMGEHERLRDTRMFFQKAAEQMSRDTVESITGRRVWAFVSGLDPIMDVSSEVFYFESLDRPDVPPLVAADDRDMHG